MNDHNYNIMYTDRENTTKKARQDEPVHTQLSIPVTDITQNPVGSYNREIGTDSKCFARDALSNYLVLKSIFSNLDNRDLDTCCQVNQSWNSIADPLLVSYYDIKVMKDDETSDSDDDSDSDNLPDCSCFITKQATYKTQAVHYSSRSLEAASKLLDTALETEKIAINLKTPWFWHEADEDESLTTFASKYGTYVEKLGVAQYFTGWKFCKFLVRYFPNLKHLDLSETSLGRGYDWDESEPEISMKYLRRIDVNNGLHECDRTSLVNIFQVAPNLEEIHEMPSLFIDAVVQAGTARFVKSINYPRRQEDPFLAVVKKLAKFRPKLHSFSFEYLQPWPEDLIDNVVARTERYVCRILQSSHDSLQTLGLCKSGSFDFSVIPPMKSLKELTFWLLESENCVTPFLPADIVLKNMFPNTSTVEIRAFLSAFHIPIITNWFPESQYVPWGSQITKMRMQVTSVDLLRQLSRLFPSVKDLQFYINGTKELKCLLSAIGKYWPETENITAVLSAHQSGCWGIAQKEPSFDAVFTGIAEDTLVYLRDPVSTKQHFTSNEIKKFKEESNIRKLSKLKVVRFDCHRIWNTRFFEQLSSTSSVSKEFGFQFLPGLKIIVRTPEEHFQMVSDMKASLEPLVNLEIEVQV